MLIGIFFISFVSLFFLRKVAQKIGLVDRPNARKQHQGAVPLVGGISLTAVLFCALSINPALLPNSSLYLFCVITLAAVGVLDDRFELRVSIRIIVQVLLSLLVIYKGGLSLTSFGNLFGIGEITLAPWGSVLISVVAVIGAINAFNMVDGIDGLLGGLSTITLASIGILYTMEGNAQQAQFCWILIMAILPYIFMNLGLLGRTRKIFMGDAGSMVIGFTVVWLLVGISQTPNEPIMKPVTALWIIMIPLMDMAAIMIRRIRQGNSPFKPDREHLHHIFQRVGLSSYHTLFLIVTLGCFFASIGIYSEYANLPDAYMFWGFIACFSVYFYMLNHVWILTKLVRSFTRRINKKTVSN